MRNVTILLAVVAMLAVTAQAAPTVYEPYAYAPTWTELEWNVAGSTEVGFSAGYSEYGESKNMPLSEPSLAYPVGSPLVSVGERVDCIDGEAHLEYGSRLMRELSAPISMATNNTFYMSALFRYQAKYAYPILTVGLTAYPPSTSSNTPGNNLQFGMAYETYPDLPMMYVQGAGGVQAFGADPVVGETYLLVVKVVSVASGDDMAYLKVYDSSATDLTEPVAWDLIVAAPSDDVLTHFIMRRKYVDVDTDEFRLGDTWMDVTGVPEPATMVLLGIGGIGVLLRRRKK